MLKHLLTISLFLLVNFLGAQYFHHFEEPIENEFIEYYYSRFINDDEVMLWRINNLPFGRSIVRSEQLINNNNQILNSKTYPNILASKFEKNINVSENEFGIYEMWMIPFFTKRGPRLFYPRIVQRIGFSHTKVISDSLHFPNNTNWDFYSQGGICANKDGTIWVSGIALTNTRSIHDTASSEPDSSGMGLIKIDTLGNVIFDTIINILPGWNIRQSYFWSSKTFPNNGVVIATAYFIEQWKWQISLLQFDSSGLLQNQFVGDDPLGFYAHSSEFIDLVTLDSSILLCYPSQDTPISAVDIPMTDSLYIQEFDFNLNKIWSKRVPVFKFDENGDTIFLTPNGNRLTKRPFVKFFPRQILKDSEGHYIVLGQDTKLDMGAIIKVDKNTGGVRWYRALSKEYQDEFFNYRQLEPMYMAVNSRDEIVVGGRVDRYGYYAWLDKYGCLEEDCHLSDQIYPSVPYLINPTGALLHAFPNPVQQKLTIDLKSQDEIFNESAVIEIFDIFGKKLISESLQYLPYSLDMAHLSSGNYLLIIKNQNHIFLTKKIVKM